MRRQDFIESKMEGIKFIVSFPEEVITTQELIDDFAIGFAEWAIAKNMGVNKFTLYEGELEIYKKEKGL